MRVFLTLVSFLVLAFSLTGCPQPEVDDTGGAQVGTSSGGAPAAPAYKESKLASFGRGNLGMSFEEVKALYPEDSGYKFEDPMPDAENPLMIAATPVSEENKMDEGYGMLAGEVVYVYQAGMLTDEEYDAKIAELTAAYGDPSSDVPAALVATKFYSGDPEEAEEAEGESEEAEGEGEAAEGEEEFADAPKDEGIKNELPENALFWFDDNAKLVLMAASEDGEASFMLLRADKIDEQFDLFQKAMEEMYQKMFEEMMSQMQDQGGMPPAEGGAAPPPAEGGN